MGGPTRGCTGCAEPTWGPGVLLPRRGVMGSLLARSLIIVVLFSLGVGQWTLQRLPEKGAPSKTGVAGQKAGPMGRRALGGTVLHLPLPLRGDPTTCSKCDPSSLATPSRGPARLGCPHASPKPGREPKQTGKRQHPASDLRPQSPLPWPSIKKKRGQRRNSHRGLQVLFDMPQGNLISFEIGHPPIQMGIWIQPVNITSKGTSFLPPLRSWQLCIFPKTEQPTLRALAVLEAAFLVFLKKSFSISRNPPNSLTFQQPPHRPQKH